ncbi:hypothetical protein BN1708_014431 [Verticillium longisporum]|uniref:Uncharacterized protein n=1 Tax=Verticillium longisporum TaxID=100787 RepID=A0A0G4LXF1_VERLO|nr:hypothetical protein BN1708_014431 [Verticillium longisporum]
MEQPAVASLELWMPSHEYPTSLAAPRLLQTIPQSLVMTLPPVWPPPLEPSSCGCKTPRCSSEHLLCNGGYRGQDADHNHHVPPPPPPAAAAAAAVLEINIPPLSPQNSLFDRPCHVSNSSEGSVSLSSSPSRPQVRQAVVSTIPVPDQHEPLSISAWPSSDLRLNRNISLTSPAPFHVVIAGITRIAIPGTRLNLPISQNPSEGKGQPSVPSTTMFLGPSIVNRHVGRMSLS